MSSIRFSHIGLFVQDVEVMATFYRRTLGFVESDRGVLDERQVIFLTRDPDEHHQLIFFSGLTSAPREPVINQLSFRFSDLESLINFHTTLVAEKATDVRPINHGNAWSIYFRDPEGNRIEVYVPTPWYVSQPRRAAFDPHATADEIRAETEAWCRRQPSFILAGTFAAKIAAKLAAGAVSGDRT